MGEIGETCSMIVWFNLRLLSQLEVFNGPWKEQNAQRLEAHTSPADLPHAWHGKLWNYHFMGGAQWLHKSKNQVTSSIFSGLMSLQHALELPSSNFLRCCSCNRFSISAFQSIASLVAWIPSKKNHLWVFKHPWVFVRAVFAARRRDFHKGLTCFARWRPTWQALGVFFFHVENPPNKIPCSRWARSWHDSAGTSQGRVGEWWGAADCGACDSEALELECQVSAELRLPAFVDITGCTRMWIGCWINNSSGQNFKRPKKRFMPWRLQS